MPRNHANKNTLNKNNDFTLFSAIKSIENTTKNAIQIPWGRINYYRIASMRNNIKDINGRLYYKIRMCILKQWKKPKTKVRNLMKMGIAEDLALQVGNSRRGY